VTADQICRACEGAGALAPRARRRNRDADRSGRAVTGLDGSTRELHYKAGRRAGRPRRRARTNRRSRRRRREFGDRPFEADQNSIRRSQPAGDPQHAGAPTASATSVAACSSPCLRLEVIARAPNRRARRGRLQRAHRLSAAADLRPIGLLRVVPVRREIAVEKPDESCSPDPPPGRSWRRRYSSRGRCAAAHTIRPRHLG